MRRALVVTSLVVFFGIATLGGFAFWGGGPLPTGSLAAGPTGAETAKAGAAATSMPPLSAPCAIEPAAPRALFRVEGRCPLRTDGPAQCAASGGDDYGAYYAAKTVTGDAAYLSLGVEGYKGPGTYRSVDLIFFVLYGAGVAEWQDPNASVSITPTSVIIPTTVLAAAPGTGASSALVAEGSLPCRWS